MSETRELEMLLALASNGDKAAGRSFFERFLSFKFFVPSRFQQAPLTDSPEYPNEFFNMLGITRPESVIIPIFTKIDYIQEWSGQTFAFKEYTGKKIVDLIPEGWWVCINPGQEVEKELTSWEIAQLRVEAFDDLVEENFSNHEALFPVQIAPLNQNEYRELVLRLADEAKNDSLVKALYLLKEENIDNEDEKVERLLFGVEVNTASAISPLKEKYSSLARTGLIGDTSVNVLVSSRDESGANNELFYGLFSHYEPFYRK